MFGERNSSGVGRCLTLDPSLLIRFGLNFLLGLTAVLFLLQGLPSKAQSDTAYRLGSGDQLRVTVFGQADLSGQFDVDSNGNISLPLIGEITVIERSVRETEALIIDKLKPDYLKNPQVSVEVVNYRPFYIIGEVKNPGSYAYVGGMRVVNAIAMAGGFTYRAKESKLWITRAGEESAGKRPATQETLVLPGDVIEVPERFF
jgi:polysaccharide export outer membrane protein